MNTEAIIMTAVALAACVGTYWWGRWVGRSEYDVDTLAELYVEGYEQGADDTLKDMEAKLKTYEQMLANEEAMRDD